MTNKQIRIPGHPLLDAHNKDAGKAAADQIIFDAQDSRVGGGTSRIPGQTYDDAQLMDAGKAAADQGICDAQQYHVDGGTSF